MPFFQNRKLRWVFFLYWVLLAYIIAALVWWFIALHWQNEEMTELRIKSLQANQPNYQTALAEIRAAESRKNHQYIGEGITFFLIIAGGAALVYIAVRRQFKMNQEQQNLMMAITHELKTPIAVAKLNLETLEKRQLEQEQQQKLIRNTIRETNRLNALCNNMLMNSQLDAGKYGIMRESLDIFKLVKECVQESRRRFPERIFDLQIPEQELFIRGDYLLLQLATNNLLDNAVKYTPIQGEIVIQVVSQKNGIEITIADQGQGIPDNEKSRIFQRFYRLGNAATKSAKGTGLGLYLTQRIAAVHGGKISVHDNQPQGSVFTLYIPTTKSNDNP